MTEDQIKHMVDRFLGWRLPKDFSPDAGISFKANFNEHTAHPMKHEPIGTNLFDATQADVMVRYLIEGMPDDAQAAPKPVSFMEAVNIVEANNPVEIVFSAEQANRAFKTMVPPTLLLCINVPHARYCVSMAQAFAFYTEVTSERRP